MFVFQWILLFLGRIPLILLGLLIVPLGLLFSNTLEGTRRNFSEHNTDRQWVLEILPKWIWLWSNDRDGARGDKRGWWDKHSPFGNSERFLSKFWWLAIRNPVNNLRFTKFACNVAENKVVFLRGTDLYDVKDKVGNTGWQFLRAGKYYGFYGVWQKSNGRAIVIRLGHKIKLSHNNEDWTMQEFTKRFKGFTFRIRFNEDIS